MSLSLARYPKPNKAQVADGNTSSQSIIKTMSGGGDGIPSADEATIFGAGDGIGVRSQFTASPGGGGRPQDLGLIYCIVARRTVNGLLKQYKEK